MGCMGEGHGAIEVTYHMGPTKKAKQSKATGMESRSTYLPTPIPKICNISSLAAYYNTFLHLLHPLLTISHGSSSSTLRFVSFRFVFSYRFFPSIPSHLIPSHPIPSHPIRPPTYLSSPPLPALLNPIPIPIPIQI